MRGLGFAVLATAAAGLAYGGVRRARSKGKRMPDANISTEERRKAAKRLRWGSQPDSDRSSEAAKTDQT